MTPAPLPPFFGTAQALAAGWSPGRLQRAVARGEIVRLGPGAFATPATVAGCRATPEGRLRLASAAATLSTRRPSWASHASGLAMHRIPTGRSTPQRAAVTVDDAGGVMQRRARYDRHAARLPTWHRSEVEGVPAVTAERAVVDRCRQVPFVDRLIVGDAALNLKRVTREQIVEVLDFCSGWRGIRDAREAAAYFDGRRESPLESLSFGVFVLRGLPLPRCQVPIVDDWGDLIGVVDFYWPEHGVIGEADGRVKYRRSPDGRAAKPTTLLDEKYRQELLEDRHVVVRWGWSDATVADGAPLVTRVEKAFVRAAHRC
jgi:Transcriptional regulator, AbiEi antitoxin